MHASTRSSAPTLSSRPAAPTSFTPLKRAGLCEAVMIIPGIAHRSASRTTFGVGVTPTSTTSTPTEARPLAAAAASICPDGRVSRPRTARSASHTVPAACAIVTTSSGPIDAPTIPRTPLEPNSSITPMCRMRGISRSEPKPLAVRHPSVSGGAWR
jgi:hypothetical protein